MTFTDPEGEYGGIRFKDPIPKKGGYRKNVPDESKFADLPSKLK